VKRFQSVYLGLVVGLSFTSLNTVSANSQTISQNKAIKSVISELVTKHDFNRKELNQLFKKVERQDRTVELIQRPAEKMPWHRYRKIFIQESRINLGVEFWQNNIEVLKRAEKKFGVPAEVIVGIIGVETRFGTQPGSFRVIDALATLTADYPKRRAFFRKELIHYLKMTRKEKLDPLSVTGSYAGAIGIPQFMPSSFLSYAVDFDGDGTKDLVNSNADAIGSIANYLKRHGWQKDQPITGRAQVEGSEYAALVKKGLKPVVPLKQANRRYGVSYKEDFAPNLKGALIELEGDNGTEYWVGLNNFYAITRYNHSALYAMAVFQLGKAIKDARGRLAVANS